MLTQTTLKTFSSETLLQKIYKAFPFIPFKWPTTNIVIQIGTKPLEVYQFPTLFAFKLT